MLGEDAFGLRTNHPIHRGTIPHECQCRDALSIEPSGGPRVVVDVDFDDLDLPRVLDG